MPLLYCFIFFLASGKTDWNHGFLRFFCVLSSSLSAELLFEVGSYAAAASLTEQHRLKATPMLSSVWLVS